MWEFTVAVRGGACAHLAITRCPTLALLVVKDMPESQKSLAFCSSFFTLRVMQLREDHMAEYLCQLHQIYPRKLPCRSTCHTAHSRFCRSCLDACVVGGVVASSKLTLWVVQGYAWAEDKEHCEEYGRMLQADPSKVSQRAKKRGLPQVAPPVAATLFSEAHTVMSTSLALALFFQFSLAVSD